MIFMDDDGARGLGQLEEGREEGLRPAVFSERRLGEGIGTVGRRGRGVSSSREICITMIVRRGEGNTKK
jgi:hypothetical protein